MRALSDVPAPAKLNLFLHIVGRRDDGYHLLQSAFMLIDWCDTLHFERRDDGHISREDLSAALPPDDLVLRAARALQQATGCTAGAHIGVDKRIPTQAGMGGGSSDAATTLLALNRLWGLNLSSGQLAKLGLTLGADVPFFIHGRNAWVEGIGEHTAPLTLQPAQLIVVKPQQGLDTGEIFRASDLIRNTKPATIFGFAADSYGFGRNDLQPVAERICPQVSQALALLKHNGLSGRMTGSGSAVFAVIPDSAQVPDLASQVSANWQVRVCSNLEFHPLSGWASSDD
jgi:4-diphosphocytidyl-2-C-methyl-D-erythritol kinase